MKTVVRTGIYKAIRTEAQKYGAPTDQKSLRTYYSRIISGWDSVSVFTKPIKGRAQAQVQVAPAPVSFFQRVVQFFKGLFKGLFK